MRRQPAVPVAQTYYWTASASEYATDLFFHDAARLAALYPRLVHTARAPTPTPTWGQFARTACRLKQKSMSIPFD